MTTAESARARSSALPRHNALVAAAAVAGLAAFGALSLAAATMRPGSTLVGMAVAALVVTVLWRVDLALLLVVATGPLELAYNLHVGPLTITKAAGALCLLSFALNSLRSRRPLVVDRTQAFVIAILLFAALSTLQARHLNEAVTTTARYAGFVAVFLVITQIGGDRKLQERIAWVLVVSATVLAVVGLQAYFHGKSFVASPAQSNANDFGFSLATALPFAFWLVRTRLTLRPVVVAMMGTIATALLLSLSRGTFVGLGAGIVFLLATERRRFGLIAAAAIVATIGFVAVVKTDPARFHQALFAKEHVAQQNVATRLQAWDAAGNLAAEHPLFGIGPGNFRFYYFAATSTPPGTANLYVVHDAYIDIAAEVGFGAAIAFILYLTASFLQLGRVIRRRGPAESYARTVRVSLVIASVCAVFLSEQYFLPFWLLGGLATAMSREPANDNAALTGGL